jgi:tetratricopeptide (TPR) repeat protein
MKKSSRGVLSALLFLSMTSAAISDATSSDTSRGSFQLHVNPGATLPLGESSEFMSVGGQVDLSGEFLFANLPLLSMVADTGYSLNTYGSDASFSAITAAGGAQLNITPSAKFSVHATVVGGYALILMSSTNGTDVGGNPYVDGGLSGNFQATPGFGVGISAGYRHFFGLYGALRISLATTIGFGPGAWERPVATPRPTPLSEVVDDGRLLAVSDIDFSKIFPILYAYYGDHSVGRVRLYNTLDDPVNDVVVSLFVSRYMDAPTASLGIEELKGGESMGVELRALFTEEMLAITEGTKVAAELTVEYRAGGQRYQDGYVESLPLEYRNAMTWDDDRTAAAFVTAKDTRVLKFSKNIAGEVRNDAYNINEGLATAIAIHEGLRLYGLTYVVDPGTPYVELSKGEGQVDYLQFPRETLEYKAGDCDDLAILYSALLESVNVETAFVTVPGHIYLAIDTGLDEAEGRKQFTRSDDLIFREGRTWIPVETTALDDGFLDAWRQGAKQWWEYSSSGEVGFYPIRAAWQSYPPVGLPGEGESLEPPDGDLLAAAYGKQAEKFIDREITSKVQQLQEKIEESESAARWVNRLGVLYAQYGLHERAMIEFERVLKQENYLPALLNIGNVHYLRKDYQRARAYYRQALELGPGDAKTVLAAARVNHQLENYGTARELYQRLESIDEDLARRYVYLDLRGDEGKRAAEISGIISIVEWGEE